MDCTTPFTNTHASITVDEATDFATTGDLEIDTSNPVEKHAAVSGCVRAIYHGFVGSDASDPSAYSPTTYLHPFSFRICGEYITMSPTKSFYKEIALALNSGIYDDATIDTLGFSDIYERVYCGIQ